MDEKKVVDNIVKIRISQGVTKRQVAEAIGLNEASYGRIENGSIALSYSRLASIASYLGMSVIDVITYPKKYVEAAPSEEEPTDVLLQIKLKKDKREQVLKLVFGENNIEIFNR